MLTHASTKLLDAIEDEVEQGGYIIDWHACDMFPQSWIDLVVVLRTDSTLLYDRLASRYAERVIVRESGVIDNLIQKLS